MVDEIEILKATISDHMLNIMHNNYPQQPVLQNTTTSGSDSDRRRQMLRIPFKGPFKIVFILPMWLHIVLT